MSGMGFGAHDKDLGMEKCTCRTCHSWRQGIAELARRKAARVAALDANANMVVEYPRKDQNEKKDLYRFLHAGVVVEGALAAILTAPSPHERTVIEVFLQLPLLERGMVLEKARKAGRVRIGDMRAVLEKYVLED